MNKKTTTSVLLGMTTLSLLFLFNNCGDGFKSSGKTMDSLSSTSGTTTPPPAPTGNVVLSTSKPTNTSELNKTFKVPIVIDRTGTMSTKTLTLKIASPEIDALDPMNAFNATISPATLPPGTSFAEVTVTIGTAAPSLAQHFHVEAWDGTLIVRELEVNLTIQPVIRIQLVNTALGDANWMSNGTAIANLFMPGTRTVPFIHHNTPGLQVLFENLAPAAHVIHSSGSIPHQVNSEMAASPDGTTVGGTYMPAKIIGAAKSNAMVYTHDINADAANPRTLLFNANL